MIRVGIGGWSFEPWRGPFYPDDLPKAQELAHASRKVTAIEINSTFYSAQKPETFKRWASETPDDFMFSVKAPRVAVNRRVLTEAAPSIKRFIEGGVLELGAKLGPILWQLAPTKKFDAAELEAYFALMPKKAGRRTLRHALEVRHESFVDAAFIALARKHSVAIVFVESDKHPPIADLTADFVYARLENTQESEPKGYATKALGAWAERARTWESGGAPSDLPLIGAAAKTAPRDVFINFIAGAKVRAPAAATALLAELKR